eukprot:30142_1
MSLKTTYQVTGVFTIILSLLSICGASWIIRKAYHKRKDKNNADFIVNDYVFYMSICDLIASVQILFYWSSVAFDSEWIEAWPFGLCWISALIFQFVLISSATWSFFIAVNLVRLMAFKASPTDLKYESDITICSIPIKWNHIIVWSISIITSLIPVTDYGFTPNAEEKEGFAQYECWIEDSWYQMCLYGLIFVYVGITICILSWILMSKIMSKLINSDEEGHKNVQNRLAAYSLFFAIVWLFPLITRSHGLAGADTPVGLVVMHHLLLASVGFGNCIIWTCLPAEFDDDDDDESDDPDERAVTKKLTMSIVR